MMTKNWRHFRSWYSAFSFCEQILKTWWGKNVGYSWKY